MDRRLILLVVVVIAMGVLIFVYRERRAEPQPLAATPNPQVVVSATPASPVPVVSAQPAPTPIPSGTPAPAAIAKRLMGEADALVRLGKKEDAWKTYSEALAMGPDPVDAASLKQTAAQVAADVLFSAASSSFSETYVVKSGDNLTNIAKPYKIPYQLIVKVNRLKSSMIHPGDKLKVIHGPFNVTVDTSKLTLTAYLGDLFVKEYPVGLGEDGILPAGKYPVMNKLVNPAWTRPQHSMSADDPNNPLGERWIGFYGEYGIHGTIDPQSVGRRVSLGCVRMYEPDVEEVFDLVVSGDSMVTVKNGL